jgi:hypothetical protein
MRVLLVTDWGPVEGGVQRYFERLRDGLQAAGDEVLLLTSSAGSAAGGSADLVVTSNTRRAAQVVLHLVNPNRDSVYEVATVRMLRPDVVHVCSFEQYLSPPSSRRFAASRPAHDRRLQPVCPPRTPSRRFDPRGAAGPVCRRSGCVGSLHWLREVPRYALIERAVPSADRARAERMDGARARALGIEAEACRLAVAGGSGFRRAPTERPRSCSWRD